MCGFSMIMLLEMLVGIGLMVVLVVLVCENMVFIFGCLVIIFFNVSCMVSDCFSDVDGMCNVCIVMLFLFSVGMNLWFSSENELMFIIIIIIVLVIIVCGCVIVLWIIGLMCVCSMWISLVLCLLLFVCVLLFFSFGLCISSVVIVGMKVKENRKVLMRVSMNVVVIGWNVLFFMFFSVRIGVNISRMISWLNVVGCVIFSVVLVVMCSCFIVVSVWFSLVWCWFSISSVDLIMIIVLFIRMLKFSVFRFIRLLLMLKWFMLIIVNRNDSGIISVVMVVVCRLFSSRNSIIIISNVFLVRFLVMVLMVELISMLWFSIGVVMMLVGSDLFICFRCVVVVWVMVWLLLLVIISVVFSMVLWLLWLVVFNRGVWFSLMVVILVMCIIMLLWVVIGVCVRLLVVSVRLLVCIIRFLLVCCMKLVLVCMLECCRVVIRLVRLRLCVVSLVLFGCMLYFLM